MVGPDDAWIEQEQEYMDSLTEGQLADYMVEQGMFADFDDDCDDEKKRGRS